MPEISAKMTLDANGYINAMKQSIQYTDDFNKTVEETKKSIGSIKQASMKIKVETDARNAIENISETKKQLNEIKKNVAIMIAAKDSASESIKKIKNEAKSLVSRPFTAVFKVKDEVSGAIKSIIDKVNSLKTLASKINLGKIAKLSFDNTIGAAAKLEPEEVVMKHIIGYNNQKSSSQDVQKMTDDYISQLKSQVNVAPFSISELMSSGREAVNITDGDTKKSMDLVKLSENMAALNPGKNMMDAMDALSDLKEGKAEKMQDFGAKISQDDINKSGGIDSYFKTQISDKGNLGKVFAGGANELSKTTAGQWKTTTGNIEVLGADLGKTFLPAINKVLIPINASLDRIGKSKAFSELQKQLTGFAGKEADKVVKFLDNLAKDPKQITKYKNEFNQFIKDMKVGYQTAKDFAKAAGEILTALTPLVKFVAAHSTLFIGIWGGVKGIQAGWAIGNFIIKMQKEFPLLGKAISLFSKGAIKSILSFSTFLLTTQIGLIITGITLAVALLYEAWVNDWCGIQEKTASVVKALKKEFADLQKSWENLQKFFQDPKGAITKSVKEGIAVTVPKGTKQEERAIPQGLARDSGNIKYKALGTTYFEGGSTWVGENGPEILKLPGGSKIFSNRESNNMMNARKTAKQPQANLANPSKAKAPQMDLTTITSSAKSISPQVETWGKDIPDNLGKGIKNNTKSVTDSVTFMATKIRELIHFSVPDKGPLSDFDTYSVDMMKNFGTGIKDNTKSVVDPTTNMSTGVKNVYSALSTQSNSYGQQIVQQLGTGIQSSSSNLVDIVKTLTDKVIETFKSGFGIHSPSVVMYQMGGHLLQGLMNGMTSKDMGGFVQNWIGSMTSTVGGAVSGNLSGWITAAMALTGTGSDWFQGLYTLIMHESGGDPNSINLWDSNAAAGHPSKGLMQLIDDNMAENHLPGMEDIWNPIENIAAGIRLIKKQYGSVYNTPGLRSMANGGAYQGYANGGIADRASIFGEGQYAEAAIPLKKNSSRSQQLLDIASNYINGDKKASDNKDVKIIINFNGMTIGEEEFFDKAGKHIVNKVKLALSNL